MSFSYFEMLSAYHFSILSLYHSVILSFSHFFILSFCYHNLKFCYSVILSFCLSMILSIFPSVSFSILHFLASRRSVLFSFWTPFFPFFLVCHSACKFISSFLHLCFCFVFLLFDDVITWLLHPLSVSLIIGLCICWWSEEGHNGVPYVFRLSEHTSPVMKWKKRVLSWFNPHMPSFNWNWRSPLPISHLSPLYPREQLQV